MAQPVSPGRRRLGTFRALRHRGYRYLWMGQVGHAASLWMEQVVRPLLMLDLTGSALQVGGVLAARTVPQLVFGLLAGAVADRYNKRVVLLSAQFSTMLMQLIMGVLVVTGEIQVWHVYATAVGTGASNAFTQPARQSLIPRLVPREELLNALALNSAALNTMRIGGASLAGLLLIFFDYGHVYLLDAGIYMGVMYTTLQIRVPVEQPARAADAADEAGGGAPRRRRRSSSLFSDLLEGFRYMKLNRRILYLVIVALTLFIFGQPYQQVFIPLIAIDVLEGDRSLAGFMIALTGVGSLAGSLTIATLGSVPSRGVVMTLCLVVFGLALVLLSQATVFWLSVVALLVAGATTVTYLQFNTALLLEQTEPEFHGRVMSFLSLDRGLMSVGAVLGGALAEGLGVATGLALMGAMCSGLAVLSLLAVPTIRRMR